MSVHFDTAAILMAADTLISLFVTLRPDAIEEVRNSIIEVSLCCVQQQGTKVLLLILLPGGILHRACSLNCSQCHI